jgi:hypothetical protein
MKKLLALVALVAMVAVASVAQAATVTIGGSVSSAATINNCTVALGTITTSKVNATCTPTYDINSANGYTIDYAQTATTLLNSTTADTIASLAESAVTATTCTDSTECWSYKVATTDAGVTYGTDAGQGPAGTSYNSGEHGFAVATDGVITDGTVGTQSYTLTMTYYATKATTTDAGTYGNTGGTLTLTAL